jgi:alcohol dehydrogenase (NADP+)
MTVLRPPTPSSLLALRQELSSAVDAVPLTPTAPEGPNPEGRPVDAAEARAAAATGRAHTAVARGVRSLGGAIEEIFLPRRAADAHDVVIEVEFCGLCHSDVHAARGEWGSRALPFVTGHEMVGRVVAVGSSVTAHAVGDRVGVGCLVGSCRRCDACLRGQEMFCTQGSVGTYGAWDRFHGERTQGGYATSIVVAEDFVLKVPEALDAAAAAPLLCAGITSYSPLRAAGVGEGTRVGVAGLGGLGHLAVKLAAAMGAEVTAFTTSPAKVEAARALGAHHTVLSTDPEAMAAAAASLDVVIDAISAPHDVNAYLKTLRPTGRLAQIGLPPGGDGGQSVDAALLVRHGLSLVGSKIGGIPETQEMLDFCAEHGVATDVEVVGADGLNEAWDRMVAGDVRYRFVLDNSTL